MVRFRPAFSAPALGLALILAALVAADTGNEAAAPDRPLPDISGARYLEFGPPPADALAALPRFGAALFAAAASQPAERTEGAPLTNAPVPPGYVIGPGDGLSLSVWAAGWEQINQELTVSPEGFVNFPQLGRITVAGQTIEQLRASLLEAYRRLFTEPTLTLVLSQQRVIEVYVTGDVMRPGKYALAGMATVLTALYEAGGPSAIGSFRSIRLTRPGRPEIEIDLYDYLLTGSRAGDAMLEPGDTIFVPPLRGEVGMAGEVRRPGRYELKGEVTLAQALEMAGGLSAAAYGPAVQLWRPDARREWQLMLADVASADSPDLRTVMRDGDLVMVRSLRASGENVVTLIGAVKRPGYYPVSACPTVAALLDAAEGLAWNAHMGLGVIRRLDQERHQQIIEFNVADVYNRVPGADLPLQPKDTVEIFAQEGIERPFEVRIEGAVARPGTYLWAANLRVNHLLLHAGGLLPNAYLERADLLRLTDDQTYTVIPVNLKAAQAGDEAANLTLLRGDILKVMTRAQAGLKDEVQIAGFVNAPGRYPRFEGMKVSDLIFAAGGLRPGAGPTIQLARGHFEGVPEPIVLQLTGDVDRFQVQPDLVLEDDDSVAVSGRGDFQVRADLVTLDGRVRNPGSYVIRTGPGAEEYTAWDLIRDGGGLLEDANPAGIVVYRTRTKDVGDAQSEDLQRVLAAVNREAGQPSVQVTADNQQQALAQTVSQGIQQIITNPGSVSIVLPPRPVRESDWVSAIPVDGERLIASAGREGNLALRPGDTLVVPRRVHTVMVLGAVPRSGAVPFVAGWRCRDYINESGGLREDAARDRLVVVHANGSVEPIKLDSTVAAGDIIVVPTRHIVRTVRTESEVKQWLRSIVPLVATALLVK